MMVANHGVLASLAGVAGIQFIASGVFFDAADSAGTTVTLDAAAQEGDTVLMMSANNTSTTGSPFPIGSNTIQEITEYINIWWTSGYLILTAAQITAGELYLATSSGANHAVGVVIVRGGVIFEEIGIATEGVATNFFDVPTASSTVVDDIYVAAMSQDRSSNIVSYPATYTDGQASDGTSSGAKIALALFQEDVSTTVSGEAFETSLTDTGMVTAIKALVGVTGLKLMCCSNTTDEVYVQSDITRLVGYTIAPPGTATESIAYTGTDLLTGDTGTDLIYTYDGITETISSSYAAPATDIESLAFDNTDVFSLSVGTDTIYHQTGNTSTITTSFATPGNKPQGITVDAINIISSDWSSELIYIHSGKTSTVGTSFTAPDTDVNDLTLDGTDLYSYDTGTGEVTQHDGQTSTIGSQFIHSSGTLSGLAHQYIY